MPLEIMYTRILLPVDGSSQAMQASEQGVELAHRLGAEVVAFHAISEGQHKELHSWFSQGPDFDERRKTYLENLGQQYVSWVERCASEHGVPCTRVLMCSEEPHQAILDAAREHQCDLIYMASRGRTRDMGMHIGSEIIKLLGLSKIPVLIHRGDTPSAATNTLE